MSNKASKYSAAVDLMPVDDEEWEELVDRAKELATDGLESVRDSDQTMEILEVVVGGQEMMALPYRNLDEVLPYQDVIPVPGTPGHVTGVINFDGQLLTVLDLGLVLGMDSAATNPEGIVVVSSGEARSGLAVSSIVGNRQIVPSDIQPPPHTQSGADFITGVIDGQSAFVDLDALMNSSELLVNTVQRSNGAMS